MSAIQGTLRLSVVRVIAALALIHPAALIDASHILTQSIHHVTVGHSDSVLHRRRVIPILRFVPGNSTIRLQGLFHISFSKKLSLLALCGIGDILRIHHCISLKRSAIHILFNHNTLQILYCPCKSLSGIYAKKAPYMLLF